MRVHLLTGFKLQIAGEERVDVRGTLEEYDNSEERQTTDPNDQSPIEVIIAQYKPHEQQKGCPEIIGRTHLVKFSGRLGIVGLMKRIAPKLPEGKQEHDYHVEIGPLKRSETEHELQNYFIQYEHHFRV
jgi:hypothetical protein